jgi:predicted enzyme related to lactoylglutathione lyase
MKQIKFVSVPTANQDRALAFWTEKAGMRVVTDQPMGPGMRWIELKLPNAQTGIVLFTPEGHESRIGTFTGISFVCEDVEKAYAEMKAKGVEFAKPPKKEQWGTSAIFNDSEGNSFVLSSL